MGLVPLPCQYESENPLSGPSRTKSRRTRGDGSIRKLPSGRWQARVTTPDGSYLALGTFATKAEASRAIRDYQVACDRNQDGRDGLAEIRLGDLVCRYIEQGTFKPRTRKLYARLHREWIDATLEVDDRSVALGSMRARDIAATDVREWEAVVRELSRSRARARRERAHRRPSSVNADIRTWAREHGFDVVRTGRIPGAVRDAWHAAGSPRPQVADEPPNLGMTEAAQAYRLLSAVLLSAVNDGVLDATPCKIRGAGSNDEVGRHERVPLSRDEVLAIVDDIPERYRLAVIFAAQVGLRYSEQFALRRRDLRFTGDHMIVRVERAIVDGSGAKVRFGAPKSKAGLREIPVYGDLVAAMREYLTAAVASESDALVFVTSGGNPPSSAHLNKLLKRAAAATGHPSFSWHDLRHTAAGFAVQAGTPQVDLMRLLGHSSTRAAARYQHANDQRMHESARRVGDVLSAAMSRDQAPAAA